MYCNNCGKHNPKDSNFCQHCGKAILDKERVDKDASHSPKTNKNSANIEYLAKLQKRYKNTGNLSMLMGFLGFIISMVVGYAFEEIVTDAIVALLINAPFFYFGKKIKESTVENLNYALKISKGMLLYLIVFIIFNLVFGGIGWLWFILVYYYYKTYKETKNALKLTNKN